MRRIVCSVVVAGAFAAQPVSAAPLLNTSVFLSAGASGVSGLFSCSDSGASTAACGLTATFNGLDANNRPALGDVRLDASALATFGTVNVHEQIYLNLDLGHSVYSGFFNGSGSAEFYDDITLVGSNDIRFVQYRFGTTAGRSQDPTSLRVTNGGQSDLFTVRDDTGNLMTSLFAITTGQTFNLTVQGFATLRAGMGDLSASENMSATLLDIFAFDEFGRRLDTADYRILSAASAPYASTVPEPASMFLLGTALAGLTVRKFRR